MNDILKDNDIVVITGPMKCGKTRQLIELYNHYKAIYNCSMFKPELDNRFAEHEVVDRDKNKIPCNNIKELHQLKEYELICDLYFIDEFQFLNGNIDTILTMVDKGKKFIISGLNLTSDKKPFGLMPHILSCADEVIIKTANCDICGEPAKYTYCGTEKQDDILVGDEQYKSVCKKCYKELRG